ncbi:unnamed protein product, partial [Symbiodinium microadriaticum]
GDPENFLRPLAEQPEINPAGDLQDDPVPRKDEETAAECIRLQSILDRMKQLMREERAVWNEERAQLLEELSATRRALSASEAAREAAELALAQSSVMRASSLPSAASAPSASLQPSFQPPSRHFGGLGGLRSGPESAEIAVLKDGVRKALDAMSLERPSGPSVQEFRARAYSRQTRPAGQWTRMQLEDDANRFKTADDAALANDLDFSFEAAALKTTAPSFRFWNARQRSFPPFCFCQCFVRKLWGDSVNGLLGHKVLCSEEGRGGGDNGSDETAVPDDACGRGLWSLLTLRDFADLGGTTKHYRGLRTLAEWDESNAMRRLEWDPLMICAPPALRYSLLAAMQVRRQLWTRHGPSLGAGWDWFSAKVCRRMAVPTFLRWASLQHDGKASQEETNISADSSGVVVGKWRKNEGSASAAKTSRPGAELVCRGLSTGDAVSSSAVLSGQKRKRANDADEEAEPAKRTGMRFRCGRSDAVDLSEEAVNDIYETVQRWHSKEHREMMRAHFQGTDTSKKGKTQLPRANSGVFSVTPTLDAHEATVFALNESQPEPDTTKKPQAEGRGAASINIEEAQLRLAVELSKREAEQPEKEKAQETEKDPQSKQAQATPEETQTEAVPAKTQDVADVPAPEFEGLPLRGEGGVPAAQVFVKPHCLAARVEALPDALERSIESIAQGPVKVHKLVTPDSWALLYESITEEARAVGMLEDVATDTAKLQGSSGISLDQERLCLPIWRRSSVMSGLSCLTDGPDGTGAAEKLRLNRARHDFLKHAMLEWCELEDLTEFLDVQLGPLEMAIDNFRGSQEVNTAHTPHVRDIGRLMFRNHCLLDSRVFRPLCLAAYALVHEIHGAAGKPNASAEKRDPDSVDALVESYEQNLVSPISAAMDRFGDKDVMAPTSGAIHPETQAEANL